MDEAQVSSTIAASNKDLTSQSKALVSESISGLKRAHEASGFQQMAEIKRIKGDPVPQVTRRVTRTNI